MINKVEEEVESSKGEELLGAEINLKDNKESLATMKKVGTQVIEEYLEGGDPMREEYLMDQEEDQALSLVDVIILVNYDIQTSSVLKNKTLVLMEEIGGTN